MDFSLSPELERKRKLVRAFVNDRLIPLESDPASYDAHENIRHGLLTELRKETRAMWIWAIQSPVARGGGGLKMADQAVLLEEMNRSIFGPVCFNSAAPDDGNMRVLSQVGMPAQQDRWLQPIIDGKINSAFIMTEPMDEDGEGCGSDPSLTKTEARRTNTGWVINGHKWFSTGAETAQHFILMARTSPDPRKGLSAFMFDRDQPGWRIVRRIPIMGPEEHGGHCELAFEGLEIPDENRLMEVGDGLKLTQIRLGPARLTHCMRWLGLARRCLEIAQDYVSQRKSFGGKLIDHESVQTMLGQAGMEIQMGRLLTMHAAWTLDQGDFARKEVSIAKVVVADALQKAADTALQLLGARGYSKDTIVEWVYRYARQARLVDGASEIHRMVLAKNMIRDKQDFFGWPVRDA